MLRRARLQREYSATRPRSRDAAADADLGFATCRRGHRLRVIRAGRGLRRGDLARSGNADARRVRHTPRVPATVIVGAQWGDEGKGKIVDLLAAALGPRLPLPGRAERRAHDRRRRRDLQDPHIPSGILTGKECVIGAGCVVDPQVLIEEIDDLESRGHDRAGAPLGERAPDHALARRDRRRTRAAARQAGDRHHPPRDRPRLRRQGDPDRDPRPGPARPEDPAPEDRGRARREERLAREGLRDEPIALETVDERYERYADRLRPYVADTSLLVDRALRDGQGGAVRGRAGDAARPRPRHVSRSSPRRTRSPATRPSGSGSGRRGSTRGRRRQGLRHPGRRRPLPDRDRRPRPGADARARRRVRHGHRARAPLRLARPRRAPLRGAGQRDHLARADQARRALGLRRDPCLLALPPADGTETEDFPAHQSDFHHASRCTRRCPGWREPLDADRRLRAPPAARAYVELVERGSRSRSRSSAPAPSASACSRSAGSKRWPARRARGPSRRRARAKSDAARGSPIRRKYSSRIDLCVLRKRDEVVPAGPTPNRNGSTVVEALVGARDLERALLDVLEARLAAKLAEPLLRAVGKRSLSAPGTTSFTDAQNTRSISILREVPRAGGDDRRRTTRAISPARRPDLR